MANYDVGDALSRIENILLDSIGRNMKRHLKEEADLQKAWSMWQTEQLAGLGNWSAKNYKQFAPQFTKINNSALNMLQQANQNGELNQEIKILQTGIQNAQRFFDVPNDKLDSLLKSVRSDLSRAEHAILRKADDVYREALFDSHFYLQSGTGTLNSAIDMAVSDLHQRGLNSVTYRNGAQVSASGYARMALRSANERAQLLGEGKARDKFGIHTVIVPPSGIACPKCAPWLCRVLVDDVYSAGTPQEAEELELPLLSEAIRQGFLHPQCNCSPQTYFPDSPVPEMSESQRSESVRKYRITQKQRYHERQIRKWKQAEKSAPDDAAKKAASARKREWQKRNKDLCDANHDFLRRDYFREKIYDNQTPPIVPNVIDKPTPPEPTPKITEAKPAVISENSPKTLDFSAQSDIIETERALKARTFESYAERAKEHLSLSIDGLKEMSLESVRTVTDCLHQLYKEMPELSGFIQESVLVNMNEICKASLRWTGGKPTVILKLSRQLFTQMSIPELETSIQEIVNSHYFSPKQGIYGVLKHELVHFTEFYMTLKKYSHSEIDVKKSLDVFELASEIKSLAFKNTGLEESNKIIEAFIGIYATENAAEFIAEAYSSTADNVLVNEVKRILKKKWGI